MKLGSNKSGNRYIKLSREHDLVLRPEDAGSHIVLSEETDQVLHGLPGAFDTTVETNTASPLLSDPELLLASIRAVLDQHEAPR
jgi:hypothetical protein